MPLNQQEIKFYSSPDSDTEPRVLSARASHIIMIMGMMISDVLALLFSALFAALMRNFLLGGLPLAIAQWVPILVVVFLLVYIFRGLYPGIGLGVVEEFRLLSITTSLVFLCVGAATYIGGVTVDFSRLTFLIAWGLALLVVPFFRVITRQILTSLKIWGELVAIIGEEDAARRIADNFLKYPKNGLKPIYVGCSPEKYVEVFENSKYRPRIGVVLYHQLDELPGIRDTYKDIFERLILFSSEDEGLHLSGIHVLLFGEQLVFEVKHTLLDPASQIVKRVMDLVLSTVGLLLSGPFILLLGLLIKLDSKGPVFYHQPRVGKNGDIFKMVKFRTMYLNADEKLAPYLEKHPEAKAEWDQFQKLKNDPRITPVGKFIRRFSLDELPQLWNIFIGEMSVVGPRPFMLNQTEIYGEKIEQYQRVLPGLTGLWQISGRNKNTFAQRAELDVRYIMSWSIWLDIYILIRTIWVVIIQEGAN